MIFYYHKVVADDDSLEAQIIASVKQRDDSPDLRIVEQPGRFFQNPDYNNAETAISVVKKSINNDENNEITERLNRIIFGQEKGKTAENYQPPEDLIKSAREAREALQKGEIFYTGFTQGLEEANKANEARKKQIKEKLALLYKIPLFLATIPERYIYRLSKINKLKKKFVAALRVAAFLTFSVKLGLGYSFFSKSGNAVFSGFAETAGQYKKAVGNWFERREAERKAHQLAKAEQQAKEEEKRLAEKQAEEAEKLAEQQAEEETAKNIEEERKTAELAKAKQEEEAKKLEKKQSKEAKKLAEQRAKEEADALAKAEKQAQEAKAKEKARQLAEKQAEEAKAKQEEEAKKMAAQRAKEEAARQAAKKAEEDARAKENALPIEAVMSDIEMYCSALMGRPQIETKAKVRVIMTEYYPLKSKFNDPSTEPAVKQKIGEKFRAFKKMLIEMAN